MRYNKYTHTYNFLYKLTYSYATFKLKYTSTCTGILPPIIFEIEIEIFSPAAAKKLADEGITTLEG